MPLLEELLTPTSVTIGLVLSLILALFIYFRQAVDTLNQRLVRLELEFEYRKELNGLRKEKDELERKLSGKRKKT